MYHASFYVKGMHCRSCEIILGGELKKIRGVIRVNANSRNGHVEIFSEADIDRSKIVNVVKNAGYFIADNVTDEGGGNGKKPWLSRDPKVYRSLAASAVILVILYYVLRALGLNKIDFGNGQPSSLLIVLVVGLTAGFSTCMALVGGLVLGFAARFAEKHPLASPAQKFRPHLFFNLGRIVSYFVLGGIIALAGEAFRLSGTMLGLITILVGLVMLVLGVQLTELFPRISSGVVALPSSIGKALGMKGHETREYSHKNAMIGGALTFFLPCGFTQAMQIYAVTSGSFISGALIMGIFALGTAPGLLGIGGLVSALKGNTMKHFYRFAGVLVLVLGVVNFAHGVNLAGWGSINFSKPKSVQTTETNSSPSPPSSAERDMPNLRNVEFTADEQIARMEQLVYDYKPDYFEVKKGIKVKWIVNSQSQYSCAAALMMPAMGIQEYLNPGENVFEFTPDETGTLRFSCAMGMYTGSFKVVE